jgi:hypothetical protein
VQPEKSSEASIVPACVTLWVVVSSLCNETKKHAKSKSKSRRWRESCSSPRVRFPLTRKPQNRHRQAVADIHLGPKKPNSLLFSSLDELITMSMLTAAKEPGNSAMLQFFLVGLWRKGRKIEELEWKIVSFLPFVSCVSSRA